MLPTFQGSGVYYPGLIGVGVFLPAAAACWWFTIRDYRAHKLRTRRGVPKPLRIPGARTALPGSYSESRPTAAGPRG